jgi:hypothetical protein
MDVTDTSLQPILILLAATVLAVLLVVPGLLVVAENRLLHG